MRPSVHEGRWTGALSLLRQRAALQMALERRVDRMKKLVLLAAVVFTVTILVGTGAAKQASSQAKGTMVIGLEQEPGILNGWITGGDALATVYVTSPMLSSAYRLKPNMVFQPELITRVKVQQNPFR